MDRSPRRSKPFFVDDKRQARILVLLMPSPSGEGVSRRLTDEVLQIANLKVCRDRSPRHPGMPEFCGDYDTFCIDRKYPKNNKAGWDIGSQANH